jgi:hypothetical protein
MPVAPGPSFLSPDKDDEPGAQMPQITGGRLVELVCELAYAEPNAVDEFLTDILEYCYPTEVTQNN